MLRGPFLMRGVAAVSVRGPTYLLAAPGKPRAPGGFNPKGALDEALRDRFFGASGSERAGARDDRALQGHDCRRWRSRASSGGLGPAPAGVPALEGAQGALRTDEHRDRSEDPR